jgi:multiple sugar transport system permease protein
LAGLQGVPQEFYEAAEVDGANRWQRFRHVTLPLLSPTTFFIVVLQINWALQVFQEIFVMTEGGPAQATTTMVYYIYVNGWRYFKMGKASALAWVLLVLIGILTAVQFAGQKRWVHYEI